MTGLRRGVQLRPSGKAHPVKEGRKLGIHASACTELVFTDCEVPAQNRIGNEDEGYKITLSTLDSGRAGIAAQATGIAQDSTESALAQQRHAFGHPIADFQAIQFMLADMATEIDGARLLVRRTVWNQDSGARFTIEASMAKLFTSEMPREWHTGLCRFTEDMATAANIRWSGSTGMRITEIYEGMSEIQRLIIAGECC